MQIEAKKELDNQREKDFQAMKGKGSNPNKNLIYPKFAFDERIKIYREVDPPPPSLFVGLGFTDVKELFSNNDSDSPLGKIKLSKSFSKLFFANLYYRWK